jgi:hypothetical protein
MAQNMQIVAVASHALLLVQCSGGQVDSEFKIDSRSGTAFFLKILLEENHEEIHRMFSCRSFLGGHFVRG